mgnify:FL=1
MIKNFFYIPFIILMITGCTSNPNDTNPNLGTRGLLICETNEICPIVTVVWNETHKDILKVNLSLSSVYKKYNIEKVVFSNDIKNLSFNVIGPTEIDFIFKANRSRNSIIVPINMMTEFQGSQNVFMKIYTDQGVIKRYIVKDNVKAPVFVDFSKYYK